MNLKERDKIAITSLIHTVMQQTLILKLKDYFTAISYTNDLLSGLIMQGPTVVAELKPTKTDITGVAEIQDYMVTLGTLIKVIGGTNEKAN